MGKRYVTKGPQLWVSSLLWNKGCLSTQRIWEEHAFAREETRLNIPSKSHLKKHVLGPMYIKGKITKGEPPDFEGRKSAGWKVVPTKAFRNTHPDILKGFPELPPTNRMDVPKRKLV